MEPNTPAVVRNRNTEPSATWTEVNGWADVPLNTRVKVVVGPETVVGLYFGDSDDDERFVARHVTSDYVGDVSFEGFLPSVDALFVESLARHKIGEK